MDCCGSIVASKPLNHHEEHRFCPCPRRHHYAFFVGSFPTNFIAR
jgi:hypothetical protein